MIQPCSIQDALGFAPQKRCVIFSQQSEPGGVILPPSSSLLIPLLRPPAPNCKPQNRRTDSARAPVRTQSSGPPIRAVCLQGWPVAPPSPRVCRASPILPALWERSRFPTTKSLEGAPCFSWGKLDFSPAKKHAPLITALSAGSSFLLKSQTTPFNSKPTMILLPVGALLAAPAAADFWPSPRASCSALRLFSRALRPPYFHYRLESTSAVCFVGVTSIFNHF